MALSGPTQELVLTPTLQIGNSIKLDIRTATARCPFFGLYRFFLTLGLSKLNICVAWR